MTRDQRAAGRARRGFSLIELLLVIGIIMIFLGLSIGAVMRTPRVNAIVGTEQMIADVIRQARHTARSSGAPVMIEIAAGDKQVMGVSQLPIWTQSFEAVGTPTIAQPDLIPPEFSTDSVNGFGLTGKGLITQTSPTTKSLDPILLVRQNRLVRPTASNRTEGFYVSCAVRPPAPGDIEPLIMIGGDTENSCTCGLRLQLAHRTVQDAQTDLTGAAITAATYDCWKIVGWVNVGGAPIVVDSVANSLNQMLMSGSQESSSWKVQVDRTALQSTNSEPHDDIADPIPGGRWEEIGLLYDGQRLELYHDRALVAVQDCSGALDPGDSSIHVGHGHFPVSLLTINPAETNFERYLIGTLDDARLMRLGVDRAGVLPSGVSAAADYRIVVRPDGRVDLQTMAASSVAIQAGSPAVNPAVLTFGLPGNASEGDKAEITVYPDGRVASKVITGAAP